MKVDDAEVELPTVETTGDPEEDLLEAESSRSNESVVRRVDIPVCALEEYIYQKIPIARSCYEKLFFTNNLTSCD